MLNVILELLIGLLVAAVMAIFGWAWAISNRVTVLETDKVGLKELMISKFDEVSRRLGDMERKLERRFEISVTGKEIE